MRGAKRIVHIRIRKGSEVFAEFGEVFGLFFSKTGVLQQYDVAVIHCGYRLFGVFAHYVVVVCKHNILTQQFRKALCHRCKGELLLRTVLGLAEM